MKRVLMIAAAVLISSLPASAASYVATDIATPANGGTASTSLTTAGGTASLTDMSAFTQADVAASGSGKTWAAVTFGSVKTFNHIILEQTPSYVVKGYDIQVANVVNPDGDNDAHWTTVSGGSFTNPSNLAADQANSESTINLGGNYSTAGVRVRATNTLNVISDGKMRVKELFVYSNYSNLAQSASITSPGWAIPTIRDQKTTLQAFNSNLSANPDITYTWATPQTIGAVQMHYGTGAAGEYVQAYTIQYWNGSSFVNALSVSGNTSKFTYDLLSYPVTTTQLRIHVTQGGPSEGNTARIAEVFVFEAVPEPSSMAVISIGVLGLLRRRNRSK